MTKALKTAEKAGNELVNASDMEFDGIPTGLENVTAADLLMPRLAILQGLSPQLDKSKPEYIKGAEASDFCDTGALEVFKEELLVVPCYYARVFLEWAPRNTGKGLVKNHGTDSSVMLETTRDDKNRNVLPNGNYIVETGTWFVLNITAGGRKSFIALSSTQMKASRQWMNQITNARIKRADGSEFMPPIFYRAWKCTAVSQSNNDGSWHGWKFTPDKTIIELDPSKNLLRAAKEFHEQAHSGAVQGDLRDNDEAAEPTNNGAM